jgi:hypothetical protein
MAALSCAFFEAICDDDDSPQFSSAGCISG